MQDEKGSKSVRRAAHVKACEPVDKVINQLPPQAVYEQYGRRSKLLIHPKDVPDIPFQLFKEQQDKQSRNSDDCDKSQNSGETGEVLHEICQKDKGVMRMLYSHPMASDTIDELRSRSQGVKEECDVNMVTVDLTQAEIDSIDESRNRLNIVTLAGSMAETTTQMRSESVCHQDDIDTGDTSRSRVYKSTLNVTFNNRQEFFKVTDDGTEMTEQEGVEQTWNPGQTVCDPDEESRCRQARCFMSTDQQMQQPVTPVVQSGSVGPTVVNIQDVDECLVTNIHTNVKHGSISTSNKWLSSTFSMITSGILGKSNTIKGKDVTENVDASSNTKLVFKPEFNFFL